MIITIHAGTRAVQLNVGRDETIPRKDDIIELDGRAFTVVKVRWTIGTTRPGSDMGFVSTVNIDTLPHYYRENDDEGVCE